MRDIASPFDGFASPFGPQRGFSPSSVVSTFYASAWYDPSDMSTLFQDSAGTIPVTASNDPVGLMKDKSGNGLHMRQTVALSRPTFVITGSRRRLYFDGLDDCLLSDTITPTVGKFEAIVGLTKAADPAARGTVFNMPDNGFSAVALEAPLAAGTNTRLYHAGLTTGRSVATALSLNTPVVYGIISDLAGPTLTLRANGVQAATDASTTGGGNFRSGQMSLGDYVTPTGRRFQGYLNGAIFRWSPTLLTAAQMTACENWMNSRTGAY